MKKRLLPSLLIWVVLFSALAYFFQQQHPGFLQKPTKISYHDFWAAADSGLIRNASVDNQEATISGEMGS